jgi:penicillin amidase
MNRFVKWALLALPVIFAAAALAVVAGYLYVRQSLPQTEGTLALPALAAPVTVVRDAHGIPTVRAESLADAHRALGFLHAQDRLWQMDFMRRTAEGRLSEVVGEGTVGVDRFMRTLGFGQLAQAQLGHQSAQTQAALEHYAQGVNAFIDRDPVWPLEFQILGYTPERWDPADSLAWVRIMALQLSGNFRDELARAAVKEQVTEAQYRFLYPDDAGDGVATIARTGAWPALAEDFAGLLPYALEPKSASNAWVTAARGGTGPMLANDPHLGLQAPGYWYLARVETPAHTLVGATAPGLPFHIVGRNRQLAWGLTTTHSDTQDLFLEKLDPNDPRRYATPDGWARFETRTERIRIADAEQPLEFEVRSTRHGPIISDTVGAAERLASEERAVSLAWPGLRAQDRTPDAFLRVNTAGGVAEALAALEGVEAPQQNVFVADVNGNIAVAAPARVPIRKRGDGTLPRPGWTGDWDWTGFVPRDRLPRSVNPESGRLINGNNRIVGDDYPYLLAAHWPPPWRAERIAQRLDRAPTPAGEAAMWEILLDTHSPKAAQLLPRLLKAAPASRTSEEAWRQLDDWDGHMDVDEAAPLIFTAWIDMLNRALFADELGARFRDFARPDPERIARALDGEGDWCDDTTTEEIRESCEDQIRVALEDALASLDRRFGGEPADWRWGDAHVARFPHPMFSRLPLLGTLFSPEVGTPGGDETINRGGASYAGGERKRYTHVHGPGLRAVHDLSQPPASSRFMIADGQSGNPLSAHFGGLADTWRDGGFLKLVGDTQDAAATLRLVPQTD